MKACRACGYTRRPDDTAPDYECPGCGRVYAKSDARYKRLAQGSAGTEPSATSEPGHQESTEKQSAVVVAGSVFLLIVTVIVVGFFGAGYVERWQDDKKTAQIELDRQAEAQRRQVEREADRARLAKEQAAKEADPAYIEQQRRDRQALELARERESAQTRRALAQAQSMASIAGMHGVVSRWDDLLRVAEATPRIALAGPVQQMQAIRRETGALQVSSCVQPGKDALLKAMDFRITQFLSFMQNHNADARTAVRGYESAIREMQRVLTACVR